MKYIITSFLVVSSILRALAIDTNKPLKIDLELSNLPDGTRFYLYKFGVTGGLDTLRTTISKNGTVQLVSDEIANGEQVFVNFEKPEIGSEKKRISSLILFIDSQVVHIKGDIEQWPKVDIEGSKATEVYTKYHESKEGILKKVNDAMAEMARQTNPDSIILKSLLAEYRAFAMDYFRKNINVLSTPFMIERSFPLTPEDKQQLLTEMSAETRGSYYGKVLEKNLVYENNKYAIAPAQIDIVIPDIILAGEDGTAVSLKELVSKGEYTLIDFWAYWCAPCRAAIPEIKKVYEEYKDKGFNVVGVSIDPDQAKWKKALGELGAKWINVIEPGSNKTCQRTFSMAGIPAYVLVNKNAEIIAMSIVGNKNSGASTRYFSETKSVFLDGSTIGSIISGLLERIK